MDLVAVEVERHFIHDVRVTAWWHGHHSRHDGLPKTVFTGGLPSPLHMDPSEVADDCSETQWPKIQNLSEN